MADGDDESYAVIGADHDYISPSSTDAHLPSVLQEQVEFTDYYFSKSAFKEKLVAPLDKLYAADDKFIEYTSKYSALLRSFSAELDKLKDKYERATSKFSEVYSVNQCYSAFSDILKCQSALMTEHSIQMSKECFGSTMRKGLNDQKAELDKLNMEVDRADKAHMDTVTSLKSKRKACHSLIIDSERVEDKRPDPSVVSEKLVKYKNNRDLAARKLDESNEEYIKTCSDSNKARLAFEMTLQDALCKYQHLAADRVYLVQTNCSKFLELHEDFSEKFTNTSAKFKTCVQSIDVQNEVNKFVQITTANSKQELEPEMIIFDLPHIRDEDPKKDETKFYTIRQLRKQICIRKIDNLRKREAQIFKNLEFARVLLNKAIQDSHGMQGKFTDQEKGQQEFSALLHELDIVQVSIQNLVEDYFALNRSNSPREKPHHLNSYLTPVKESHGKGTQYMVIRPPLDYYYNNERDTQEIDLPDTIQQEIVDMFGTPQQGGTLTGSRRESLKSKGPAYNPNSDRTDMTAVHAAGLSATVGAVRGQSHQQVDTKSQDSGEGDHWEDDEAVGWKAIVKFTFDPAALYPDTDQTSNMLKVEQGQTITVLENLADAWCLAQDSAKNTGHVPSAYIEPI